MQGGDDPSLLAVDAVDAVDARDATGLAARDAARLSARSTLSSAEAARRNWQDAGHRD
jgi:hypothetical protein